jgi:hypothetical protein
MSKLEWDKDGERLYETGVEKGVLYPYSSGKYASGVAWNGLTKVTESPSGAEATNLYADGIKYLSLMSSEEFAATIEAYTYPDEFEQCNGTAELSKGVTAHQQKRSKFGFSYVTRKGNDEDADEYGYVIHIVYNALAKPTQKDYETVNETPNAITLSWEISTTKVSVPGMKKPTALITIDSTKVDSDKLAALEEILYGNDKEEARLPLPDELASFFKTA